jgi:hypothetical protein
MCQSDFVFEHYKNRLEPKDERHFSPHINSLKREEHYTKIHKTYSYIALYQHIINSHAVQHVLAYFSTSKNRLILSGIYDKMNFAIV